MSPTSYVTLPAPASFARCRAAATNASVGSIPTSRLRGGRWPAGVWAEPVGDVPPGGRLRPPHPPGRRFRGRADGVPSGVRASGQPPDGPDAGPDDTRLGASAGQSAPVL